VLEPAVAAWPAGRIARFIEGERGGGESCERETRGGCHGSLVDCVMRSLCRPADKISAGEASDSISPSRTGGALQMGVVYTRLPAPCSHPCVLDAYTKVRLTKRRRRNQHRTTAPGPPNVPARLPDVLGHKPAWNAGLSKLRLMHPKSEIPFQNHGIDNQLWDKNISGGRKLGGSAFLR